MRDVPGQSWDILQTRVDWMSGGSHVGRPGTVLGHPCKLGLTSWLEDPMWDVLGQSWDSAGTSCKLGLTRCPEDPMRDVPGQSWDIPTNWGDLLSGGSHEGCPGTILGHPAN